MTGGAKAGAAGGEREGAEARVIPYERRFERDLVEVCWETGFMGESLSGLGRFDDKRLFAELFLLPYLRSDPGRCFVAAAGRGASELAVGYVIGAADAAAHGRRFHGLSPFRILARVLLVTWWRYPESLKSIRGFLAALRAESRAEGAASTPRAEAADAGQSGAAAAAGPAGAGAAVVGEPGAAASRPGAALPAAAAAIPAGSTGPADQAIPAGPEAKPLPGLPAGPDYPAELHINLLPAWQGRGLGGRLMKAFLDGLRAEGVRGVFLQTSDRNLKALPFYERLGFVLLRAGEPGEGLWKGAPARDLLYAKRLEP